MKINERMVTQAVLLRCRGESWRRIAESLGVSHTAVRYHLCQEARLQAKSRSKGHYAANTEACKRDWSERYGGVKRKKNLVKSRKRAKQRRETDVQYRLATNLRSSVNTRLRSNRPAGSWVRDLGCSIGYLREWLEMQFRPGMSWTNWAVDGWHIDHIKPLASFDLKVRDQFLKAAHFTNLQPLWAIDNLRKSSKFSEY